MASAAVGLTRASTTAEVGRLAIVLSCEDAPMRWLASWVLLFGLAACGRASRGAGEGTATPGPSDDPAAASASREHELVAELERAKQQHARSRAKGDAAERARAAFALAEAHASAAAGLYTEVFDLREQGAADPSRRAELERRAAELALEQRAWLDAAVVAYTEVIRSDDPAAVELRPRARFGQADAERLRGNHAAIHDALVALVHDHPTHPLASPALVVLADEAFEAVRLAEAQSLYEQVLVLRGPERHYARYKLGWVALDLDDAQAALAHWAGVVSEAGADPQQRALAEAAARDCVLAYAKAGRPELARAFFTRLDPSQADALLQRLADFYRQEGRPEDAAKVLGTTP